MLDEQKWDDEADIVVVGYGSAGAVAAIEARDMGADVLLLEKMPDPGGLSIVSAGGIRIASDAGAALLYLENTCGGRTPLDVLRVLAEGMTEIGEFVHRLAATIDARVKISPAVGNYPFAGYESLGYCEIAEVPSLQGASGFHAVRTIGGGARLFAVLDSNVRARNVRVASNAVAQRLVLGAERTVHGIRATIEGVPRTIRARKGVILTCGGFEANEDMKRQNFQAMPVLTGSFLGNTGDGIAMAQHAGAALWHMWHYHGPYGLAHPDPDFPFAFYLKAVPMWTPGNGEEVSDLGIIDAAGKPVAQKTLARMAWIVVDQTGRRFMDEYPPYPGDTGCRPFDVYDFKLQRFPRNPAYMIFDDAGRRMYPIGRSAINDRRWRYDWSADNQKEVELGFFKRADSIAALAHRIDVDATELERTVSAWNGAVATGHDARFGRRAESMVPLATPPYYAARVHPVVINTQGGPRHNKWQQVLDPFDQPIPRLYAAGELGSVFGHVYMSGGNLAECFVGGWTAARHAAGLADWSD